MRTWAIVCLLLAVGCTSGTPSLPKKVHAPAAAPVNARPPVASPTLKDILAGIELHAIKYNAPGTTSGVLGKRASEPYRSGSDTVKFGTYYFVPPGKSSIIEPYATKAVVSFTGTWTYDGSIEDLREVTFHPKVPGTMPGSVGPTNAALLASFGLPAWKNQFCSCHVQDDVVLTTVTDADTIVAWTIGRYGHAIDEWLYRTRCAELAAATGVPVRGSWRIIREVGHPRSVDNPGDVEYNSIEITSDSIVLYRSNNVRKALRLTGIEALYTDMTFVVRSGEFTLCFHIGPSGSTYLDHCCDDCASSRVERVASSR